MKNDSAKKGSAALIKFAAAASVPVLVASGAPFLAPLIAVLPFLLEEDKEGKTLIEKALGGIAGACTEVLGGKAGDAINDFFGEKDATRNQDLSRALATAYLAALKTVEREINREGTPQLTSDVLGLSKSSNQPQLLKEQLKQRLPLWLGRIARSIQKDPASLFVLPNNLALWISENDNENFAETIKETLGIWLIDERNFGVTGTTWISLKSESLPEPLQKVLIERLAQEIPLRLGEAFKRPEFARAWIAFQRELLQRIVRGIKKLETQTDSIKADTETILARLNTINQLPDTAFQTLTNMTAEILQLSHEQALREEFRVSIITNAVQKIGKIEASLKQIDKKIDDLPDKVLERFQQAGIAPQPAVHIPRTLPDKPVFYGEKRAQQVEALVLRLLADAPLAILIHGGANIGKTNFSKQLLLHEKIEAHFGTQRYFFECETAQDDQSLIAQLATHLGISPVYGVTLTDQIIFTLGQQPTVLVLDNLETPWDNAATKTQVQNFLAQLATIKGIKLIASLRGNERPLDVRWHPVKPDTLEKEQARELFLSISPEFAHDPDLADLLTEMSFLPGAIRLLAAAAQGNHSLQSLRNRWNLERTKILQQGTGREADLEASYEISFQSQRMKNAPEAFVLLRSVSLLPSGFPASLANHLFPADADKALSVLGKAALLDVDPITDRYSLLNPLRQYVLKQYPATPSEQEKLRQYFFALINEWASKAGRDLTLGAQAIARLTPEDPNIETIFTEYKSKQNAGEDNQLIDTALQWGWFVYMAGGSSKPVEVALQLAKAIGDALGQTTCLFSLGDCAYNRFDYDKAEGFYNQALPQFKAIGAALGQANCLKSLGEVALENLTIKVTEQFFTNARKLYEKIGEPIGLANSAMGLGRVNTFNRHYEAATAFLTEAKSGYEKINLEESVGECVLYEGDLAFQQDNPMLARECYEIGLVRLQQCQAHWYIAEAHRRLAWISDEPERTQHRNAALAIWEQLGIPNAALRLEQDFLAGGDE